MFMSWASPRSLSGGFGLNRLTKRVGSDHHHHKGSGFWAKFCYSCAIIILAAILLVWAVIIHDIYTKRNITLMTKTFYMIGATLVSAVIFVVIVYITITFRPPRRHSTMSAHEGIDGGGVDGNQSANYIIDNQV